MNNIKKFLILVIFLGILLVNFVNAESVDAAQINTCRITNDEHYCVESEDVNFEEYGGCIEGHRFTGKTADQVEGCNIKGYCVVSDGGQCSVEVSEIRCREEIKGEWRGTNQPEECRVGCCNLVSSCGIQEKNVCEVLGGSWNSETDPTQCNRQCATTEIGCYKQGSICKYGIRSQVEGEGGTWHPNLCSSVVGCLSYGQAKAYQSCGDGTTNDDGRNVYYYDSEGNRERIAEECGSEARCADPDGKGGEDAFCQTTSCVQSGEFTNVYPSKLRSGESLCVNVLSGHYSNDGRSSALENYVISCNDGTLEPEYDNRENRETICEQIQTNDENRIVSNFIDNQYEDCDLCGGTSSKATDALGYAPIIGPLSLSGLNAVGLATSCGEGGFPGGYEKCDDFGFCGAGPLSSEDNYDDDFLWAPLGSCNPDYPPGNTNECGKCGEGGDGITNVCTLAECNALGDCRFEPDKTPGEGYLSAGGLALGTMGTGILICETIGFLPGVKDICKAGLANGFRTLSSNGFLYWGGIGLIYGIGAAESTTDSAEEPISDIWQDRGKGILKLQHAVLLNSLEQYENQETNERWPYLFIPAMSVVLSKSVDFSGLDSLLSNKASNLLGIGGYALNYASVAQSFKTGQCVAEEPIKDSDSCLSCGPGEGQWYCTKERCDILGGGSGYCDYIPFEEDDDAGKEGGYCLPRDPEDGTPPIINYIEASFENNGTEYYAENVNGKSLTISPLVEWDSKEIKITLRTDERGRCAFDREPNINFGDMSKFEYTSTNEHNRTILIIDDDRTKSQSENVKIYFKCEDGSGNSHSNSDNSNFLEFKFEPRPDQEPPVIDYIDPVNVFFPEETSNVQVDLITRDNNGVNECRFSRNSTNWDEMSSYGNPTEVDCVTVDDTCYKFSRNFELSEDWKQELSFSGDPGELLEEYPNLQGLTQIVNYYGFNIKCQDGKGNIMLEAYPWSLTVVPGFEIFVNQPLEGEVFYNNTIPVEVLTSSPTTCDYKLNGEDQGDLTIAYDQTHETIIEGLQGASTGKNYEMEIICEDVAGNERSDFVNFVVFSDEEAPELTRLWTTQNTLNILLNEESVCKYSNETPSFDFNDDDAKEMGANSIDGKQHTAPLGSEQVYYVKCRDIWDNEMGVTIFP